MNKGHVLRHLTKVTRRGVIKQLFSWNSTKSPKLRRKTWSPNSKWTVTKVCANAAQWRSYRCTKVVCLDLVCHGFLGCLPIVRIVGQGDDEERTPEYQVGHRDHDEHFHLPVMKSKSGHRDYDDHHHLQDHHQDHQNQDQHTLDIPCLSSCLI